VRRVTKGAVTAMAEITTIFGHIDEVSVAISEIPSREAQQLTAIFAIFRKMYAGMC
jgi:hypothetical protein